MVTLWLYGTPFAGSCDGGYCFHTLVPAARVVFCNAAVYDMGYMRPEDIAGTVKVRGCGGTVLQLGIQLLDESDGFPQNARCLDGT